MKLSTKSISAVFFVVLAATGSLLIKPNKAQATTTTSLTGQCGALMDITPKNLGQVAANASYGSSALLYVDFTNLTITARATVTHFPAGFSSPVAVADFPTYTSNTIASSSITLTTGPVPNSFVITPANGTGIPTFAVIAVNGGNTLLLQAENARGSGVCQMI